MNKVKIKKNGIKIGGLECPKCQRKMERRYHIKPPKTNFFYKEWDYCRFCKHLQHYSEYKSGEWLEFERQQAFLKSL